MAVIIFGVLPENSQIIFLCFRKEAWGQKTFKLRVSGTTLLSASLSLSVSLFHSTMFLGVKSNCQCLLQMKRVSEYSLI